MVHAKTYKFLKADPRYSGEVHTQTFRGAKRTGTEVKFHLNQMETSEVFGDIPYSQVFQKLHFKQLNLTVQEGLPALPYYAIIVPAYPQNLIIKYNLGKEFKLKLLPGPAPKITDRSEEYREDFSIDWKFYESGKTKMYELQYLGDFRGTPLTRVLFYPIQFSGEKNPLRIFPEISYRIFHRYQNKYNAVIKSHEVIDESDVDLSYLIVTPKRFIDKLSGFIAWKQKLGFTVDIVALEDVGSTADEIRDYLHQRYAEEETRFTYALLVGHETMFPTHYLRTGASYRTPSDLPYFTMGGDTDFIPDVFYGRLVVDTAEDIANQVKKIIEYEKGNFGNPIGLGKGIGIASNEGSNPSDVEYVQQANKFFIDAFGTSYSEFFQANSNSTPANINTALSAGAMWLTYLGHGSGTSWASLYSYTGYRTSHIKEINPGAVKPIIIDVACLNGRFKTGRFGERFMNETKDGKPIGSVAYYGGSVSISWHPPAIMARGINKMIVQDNLNFLGEALLAGQMELYNNYSDQGSVKDNFVWYHLFGDPSMILRLEPLNDIRVEQSANHLLIKDSNGRSLESVKVVFYDDLGDYWTVVSNENGVASIPDSDGNINISILHKDYRYFEAELD